MINNAPISQIHIIQQQQSKHRRRLQKIIQSRPISNQYTFSNSFMQMLQTRRMNHEKWREFNRNQERCKVMTKNQKMFNKLIDITIEDGPYCQQKSFYLNQKASQGNQSVQKTKGSIQNDSSHVSKQSKKMRATSLHHNYQLDNIRKSRIIDEQNPKIAQRIMKQNTIFDHNRDLQQFRKTREIMHRLQKFDQIKRVFNSTRSKQFRGSSDVRIRSKTLPAGQKTLQTKLNKTNAMKNQVEAPQIDNNTKKKKEKKIQNNAEKISHKKYSLNQKLLQRRYQTIQSIGEKTQFPSEEYTSMIENKKTNRNKEEAEQQQEYKLMNKYIKQENKKQGGS